MDRTSRQKKADLIKRAMSEMREEIKSASDVRRADLLQDLSMAQGDYDALLDFDTYSDDYFDAPAFDPGLGPLDLEEPGDLLPESPLDDIETQTDLGGPADPFDDMAFDDVIESMDECSACSAPVVSDDEMWTATNHAHVSYILDKIADLTASIEQYEHRAAVNGKQAKSKGARTAVASSMKKLANLVAKADFTKEATGTSLDGVGAEVMKLHKQFGLSA